MAESLHNSSGGAPPRVALFVTCIVDLIRPSVGFAAVKLLEDADCRVSVPAAQTCCGPPAYSAVRILRGDDQGSLSPIAGRRWGP